MIAMSCILLLWTLLLKCKIYYGESLMNKLTLKPYDIALAALSTKIVSLSLDVFLEANSLCVQYYCEENN
jgi:hypothetical protein